MSILKLSFSLKVKTRKKNWVYNPTYAFKEKYHGCKKLFKAHASLYD